MSIGQDQKRCQTCGGYLALGLLGGSFCQNCAQVTQGLQKARVVADPVNPGHYVKGGIEVRHVIRAFECSYNVGTAVAYLLRAPFKANYVEDIRKAVQHLQFELEDKK